MKNFGLCFILLICTHGSWSQTITKKSALYEHSFAQYLSEKLDRSQFQKVECRWNVFYIFFKVNARNEVSEVQFSDSTPAIFQTEVSKVLNTNEYVWPSDFRRDKNKKRVIVQPVFVQLLNDCQLPRNESVKYRGIDSTLENELSTSNYLGKVVSQNLISVSESIRRVQVIGGKQINFLECIMLPTCFIEDVRKPQIKM